MADRPAASKDSLIPPVPIPAEARAFASQVSGLLDGRPKDDSTVRQALAGHDSALDFIAAGLYSLASMLVGEGEDSMHLIETAVAQVEIAACSDAGQARVSSRRALAAAALELLERRSPGCLAAPAASVPSTGCIDDDDLDAAGVSSHQLERMMAGPDRERVRNWLNSLSIEARVIFALRAVAGFTSPEVAQLLAAHAGPRAATWSADSVRDVFRQGLCSLASQLIQATTAR
jgi:hypothetical protein